MDHKRNVIERVQMIKYAKEDNLIKKSSESKIS